jgi:alkanesulfonate monooxygenase SsuD/methylene tetrahydromethanopterin reductase-like flavin-dependent oxidoreductase (luciferase family)
VTDKSKQPDGAIDSSGSRAQSRQLEFGFGVYTLESTHTRPRANSRVIAEAVREARMAEDLGFDSLWMGEHHHTYSGYNPSPIVAAAYMAAATRQIVLAPSVYVLNHHGALRTSEAAAAFDKLAPGRLRLAFGMGYWEDEFAATATTSADAFGRFKGALDLVTGPFRERMGSTALWSGQMSDAGLRRAGRYSLGVVYPFPSAARFREINDLYRSAWTPRDGLRARAMVIIDTWVEDDPRRVAWLKARHNEMWRDYGVNWVALSHQLHGLVDRHGFEGAPAQRDFSTRMAAREKIVNDMSSTLVIGSSSEVVEQIGPLVEAGIDGVAFRTRFDGIGGEQLERCAERIATEVIPQLRRIAR